MMPNNTLNVSSIQILTNGIVISRCIIKHFSSMRNQNMCFIPFGIALNLRPAQFISPVRLTSECLPMPPILRAVANRNPALLFPSVFVHLIRWLKVRRRSLSDLHFVTLQQFAFTNQATRPIEFSCCDPLPGNHPFGSWNDFVSDSAVSFVVSLKQTDYLLHTVFAIYTQTAANNAVEDDGDKLLLV